MGIGGGASSSKGTPRSAGGGALTGALNAAFGLNQLVENGQFTLQGGGRGGGGGSGMLGKQKLFSSAGFSSLFGGNKKKKKRRAARLEQKQGIRDARSAFGEGTPGFDLVSNLLSGITDPVKFESEFLDLVGQSVDAQQDIFGKSAEQLSGLISSGGNPTDVSAIVNQGVNQLQEQFSTSGAGLFSSDVQGAATRLTSELNVGAQEAAQNRLLSALGLGQTFAQSGQQFASNLGTLGQQHESLFTKGGRARSAFMQVANPQSTNIFSIGSDTKSSSVNANIGL